MDDTHTHRSTFSKAPFRSLTPTAATSTNPSEDWIVSMLNDLLKALYIPIQILSPTDLTPSLLVAILESLLGQKLPIPSGSSSNGTNMLKVQKIKLFLGVLETDVLQEDVGLSKVDPRKLAAGEWAEAYFVAKVLCMVGVREGLLVSPSSREARRKGRVGSERDREKEKNVDLPKMKRGTKPRSVSDCSVRRPSYRSPRFSSPELDTTSVFYAPTATNTRDTQATITSIFDDRDNGFANGLESTPTTPAFATETPPPDQSDSKEEAATPSSVALSILPAFQTPPPAPYPTLQGRGGKQSAPPAVSIHEVATPSLLLSIEDMGASPPATVRPHQRYSKPPKPTFTFSPPGCSSANPYRRQPPSACPPSSTSSTTSSVTTNSELDPNEYPRKVSVRYSGYIERVDEDSEIASYELSRSLSGGSSSFSSSPSNSNNSSGDRSILRNLDLESGLSSLAMGGHHVEDEEDDEEESAVHVDDDEVSLFLYDVPFDKMLIHFLAG
ncbi:hypothetical protein EST38_g10457 [Candolleomyces aberdarensis]|uniref:DUF5745 domain-containing protein n=1 Tax=Candolleomyces aberdarensis TaxID=2316362 RepID=A0A4Q2D9J4_9AGAR|nr:hypothetical protein EST38_g10457 [Candolleomyces aberdarensis]